jgi:hypothetical protein
MRKFITIKFKKVPKSLGYNIYYHPLDNPENLNIIEVDNECKHPSIRIDVTNIKSPQFEITRYDEYEEMVIPFEIVAH